MLSLGRGFYELFFASLEDMCIVWAAGTVSLKPGVIRLFEWTKDFNIHTQRQTHTQVWIRLWELLQEYWMERTLYETAGAVGTPLLIDNVTKNRLYDHYAWILVDLDLSKDIIYEVMVEREGYAFPVAIEHEGLPDFCTHCKNIVHNVISSRWLYLRRAENHEHSIDKGKQLVHSRRQKQGWKPKDNPDGIGSSKAFDTTTPIHQNDSSDEDALLAGATAAPTQQKDTSDEIE